MIFGRDRWRPPQVHRAVASATMCAIGLGATICIATAAPSSDDVPFEDIELDPSTGSIDGKRAVVVYPAIFGSDGKPEKWLAPDGFTAHLVPFETSLEGSRHPCGKWFLPPHPSRYHVWAEGPGWMSPYPRDMGIRSEEFKVRGLAIAIPVVPAGYVAVPPIPVNTAIRVWLLRAEPSLRHDLGGEMARFEPVQPSGSRWVMPAGRVIPGLWDRRRNVPRALGRPVMVAAGQTVAASIGPPRSGGHVLVRLSRAETPLSPEDLDAELWLDGPGGDARPADVIVPTAESVHAVWYDTDAGPARLRGGSRHFGIVPLAVEVVDGEVSYIEGELVPRPRLDVELALPAALGRSNLSLELRRQTDDAVVARRALAPGALGVTFEALPMEELHLGLQTEFGLFDEAVDLRDGKDRYVRLDPELITIHGKVYYGDEPYPARISFSTIERKDIDVETDEEGSYEAVLLAPVRFATVFVSRPGVSPYSDFFPASIDSSRRLDFRLSSVVLRLQIVDGTTGRGIPGALVGVKATLQATGGGTRSGDAASRDRVFQRLVADDAGTVVLPPPRKGEIEILARADGYEEQTEPLRIPVGDDLTDGEYRLTLVPIGEAVTLSLLLPNGAPAIGAQVTILNSAREAVTLLSTTANQIGEVRIPRVVTGRVALVTHSEAAFLLAEWNPPEGVQSVALSLPARAPRPLRLGVLDSRGENPLDHAALALWVDGVRLQGRLLSLATGTYWQTDSAGRWLADNLPAVTVAAVAWKVPEGEPGGLEALATPARYPWPDPLELRAVE